MVAVTSMAFLGDFRNGFNFFGCGRVGEGRERGRGGLKMQ